MLTYLLNSTGKSNECVAAARYVDSHRKCAAYVVVSCQSRDCVPTFKVQAQGSSSILSALRARPQS
jgi:hypothetical protein